MVNWFRKDENGKFRWPGFGENMRVLQWIVERAHGRAAGKETLLGSVPGYEDLDWSGFEEFTEDDFEKVMSIDRELWKAEILSHEELFVKLYDRLPKELIAIRQLLLSGLWREPEWASNHLSGARSNGAAKGETVKGHLPAKV